LNSITISTPKREMIKFLDELKQIGFDYATKSGISISPFELDGIVEKKKELLKEASKENKKIEEFRSQGFLNSLESKQKKISI
jgi:DNA-directed RNA polymerase subunit beta'